MKKNPKWDSRETRTANPQLWENFRANLADFQEVIEADLAEAGEAAPEPDPSGFSWLDFVPTDSQLKLLILALRIVGISR